MISPTKTKRTILALDDDEANLMILEKAATHSGYDVKPFLNSDKALDYLNENPKSISIAVIDKMMPKINGIEFLNCMKRNQALKHIPVILQTGDVGVKQMQEGLENGAYYYLTKPFTPEMLMAILKAAENECSLFDELVSRNAAEQKRIIRMMSRAEFTIKTFTEARFLAAILSQASRTPSHTARGMVELLLNAVEHGSLEMGYQKKQDCLVGNSYAQEIAARLSNEQYQNRSAKVHIQNDPTEMRVTISDGGNGFNWQQYMVPESSLKLNLPNGRGISIAGKLLGNIQYNEKGTEVSFKISTDNAAPN